MGLASAVAGALRPSQIITWTDDEGGVVDLAGATLSGVICDRKGGESRPIAGTLVLVTPAEGVFRWDYAEEDVAIAAIYEVQFTAAFATGASPAKTKVASWIVERAI